MPVNPMIVDYLKRKRNPYDYKPARESAFADPQFMSALAGNLSKLGTVGGVSPDTSAVSNYADYLTKKNMMDEDRRRKELEGFDENEDKIAELNQRYQDIGEQDRKKSELLKEERSREDLQRKEDRELKEKIYGTYEQKSTDRNERKTEKETPKKDEYGSELHNKKRAEKLMDKLADENIEVNSRFYNISDNSESLKKLVEKEGTYSVFGTAPTEKEGILYNLALDAVKTVDAGSVVSESEQRNAAKKMVDVGNWTSKETALKSIDNIMVMAKQRRGNRIKAQKQEIDRILKGRLEPVGSDEIEGNKTSPAGIRDNTKEEIDNSNPGDIVTFKGEKWIKGKDGGLDPI